MPNREDETLISNPVDLIREVHSEEGNYQLLCCSSGGTREAWVTAAELVYELTGNAGKVVSNLITFELEQGQRIEIQLLGGEFKVIRDEQVMHSGRKAFELLMRLKEFTFEQALEWFAAKYSIQTATDVAADYTKMRLVAFDPAGQTGS